jgi:hypothetical protein
MSERQARRRGVRIVETAARLGLTPQQWKAMTRAERRAAKRSRTKGAQRG